MRVLQNQSHIFVAGFPKTLHFHTKAEIHFIAQDYSYTQELFMHCVSTGQCEQVCFSGGHFANPVMSRLREWHLYRGHQLDGHDLELLLLLAS